MGILSWIIFGLIAGILAKWIMPGKDGGGFFMTIILGIVGAVVGGWISTFFGFGKVDGFNFGSFAVAVIGAIVVLLIYRKSKLNAELSEIIKATTGSLYYSNEFTTSPVRYPPPQLARCPSTLSLFSSWLCSRRGVTANKKPCQK